MSVQGDQSKDALQKLVDMKRGGLIKTVAHPRGRSLYSQSPRGNHRSGERAYERVNLTLRRSTRSKRPNQSEKWVNGPGRRR